VNAPRLLLAAAFLLGLVLPREAASEEGGWPFGARGDAGPAALGRDLFNLGILGAKAHDADAEEAAAPTGPGPHVVQGGGRSDRAPLRLRIVLLFPDGPAARAGLVPGDVVVGVGRSPFQEDSYAELAEALVKAEAGKAKGVVTLLVERAPEGKREKVDVTLQATDKAAASPTKGPGRRRVLDLALAWLARRQGEDGGYPATLSGQTGAVVMASLAGLAWLGAGSDLEHGPYRENVEKALDFVVRQTEDLDAGGFAGRMGGASMNQTNWGYAHAAIFLGELQSRGRDPRIAVALRRSAEALAKTQEPSGGWAHGPGGPNPLGYTELNIVTGLALCALGLARQGGFEPPAETVERAEAYLQASSSGDGGVGYSDQPGQKGMGNIGRTAAAWLGYETLGLQKSAFCGKMKKYVERNVEQVFGGHASWMQHVLLAGVAASALGRSASDRFWKALETELVLARAPDGSFQPRPWSESLSMSSNSDVMFGEVWTTAAWAVALASEADGPERPGLPAWQGTRQPPPAKR
jgi:hypothetical protein